VAWVTAAGLAPTERPVGVAAWFWRVVSRDGQRLASAVPVGLATGWPCTGARACVGAWEAEPAADREMAVSDGMAATDRSTRANASPDEDPDAGGNAGAAIVSGDSAIAGAAGNGRSPASDPLPAGRSGQPRSPSVIQHLQSNVRASAKPAPDRRKQRPTRQESPDQSRQAADSAHRGNAAKPAISRHFGGWHASC
jgi:hypothetical protein